MREPYPLESDYVATVALAKESKAVNTDTLQLQGTMWLDYIATSIETLREIFNSAVIEVQKYTEVFYKDLNSKYTEGAIDMNNDRIKATQTRKEFNEQWNFKQMWARKKPLPQEVVLPLTQMTTHEADYIEFQAVEEEPEPEIAPQMINRMMINTAESMKHGVR